MKGFKQSSKSFRFPTSADSAFGGAAKPTGTQLVRPYFRSAPQPRALKEGGPVYKTIGDQGNATVQRSKPITAFDAKDGGKGPLRTGYAKGGKIPAVARALRKGTKELTPKAQDNLFNNIAAFHASPEGKAGIAEGKARPKKGPL